MRGHPLNSVTTKLSLGNASSSVSIHWSHNDNLEHGPSRNMELEGTWIPVELLTSNVRWPMFNFKWWTFNVQKKTMQVFWQAHDEHYPATFSAVVRWVSHAMTFCTLLRHAGTVPNSLNRDNANSVLLQSRGVWHAKSLMILMFLLPCIHTRLCGSVIPKWF